MKIHRVTLVVVFATAAVGTCILLPLSVGQITSPSPLANEDPAATSPAPSSILVADGPTDPRTAELTRKYNEWEREIMQCVRDYRGTEDEGARNRFRKQIAELTLEQFDLRHEVRKLELERLQKQLREVEEKVNRREQLKQEIVNRRVSELLDEDADLRWEPLATPGAPIRTPNPLAPALPLPIAAARPVDSALSSSPSVPGSSTSLSAKTARGPYVQRRDVRVHVQTPQGLREESRQARYTVYFPGFADRYARRLILSGQRTTDEDLASLSNHEDLCSLDLTGATVTDAGMESLADIDTLEALVLAGTHVTDAGMQQVGQIQKLSYLDLSNLPITDVGLRHLNGLGRLKQLVLDGTKVTAEGIGALLRATSLQDLSLDRTAVDDSSAEK